MITECRRRCLLLLLLFLFLLILVFVFLLVLLLLVGFGSRSGILNHSYSEVVSSL